MANYIEIKSITFDRYKPISEEWKQKLFTYFPEAKAKDFRVSDDYFGYVYDIAAPYDEIIYLKKVLNYSDEEISKVYLARELIKYFIISVEKYPDYVGPGGNNL